MSLAEVLKSEFSSASETCLQMGDIRGLSAATSPIPLGLGWDPSGTHGPCAIPEVVRKQQPAIATG